MVAGDVRIYGLRLNLKGTFYHPDFDFVVYRFFVFSVYREQSLPRNSGRLCARWDKTQLKPNFKI